MKWTVANIFAHKLYKESGKMIATIKHRKNEYIGYDTDGTSLISVMCSDGNNFTAVAGENTLDAKMLLRDNGKSVGFRPARADSISFNWNNQPVCIKQTERRDFTVSASAISGMITGMLGRKAIIEMNVDDDELAVILYIFAYIMLHEDDVDIV